MSAELDIITKTYDLILWSLNHTSKFPRSHRYSLATRMEGNLYALLEDLIEAKYTRVKGEILRLAALKLEQLRFQFRLSKDLQLLALRSHRHVVARIDDIGRQLGGWRKASGG